ncbi:MAG: serine protease Do [Planctomycetota bacterium]|jgi:serine protease Do
MNPSFCFAIALLGVSAGVSAAHAPVRTQQEVSVADVFAKVHTGVVTLHTTSNTASVESYGLVVEEEGTGSGVIISATGDILTAAHVVQNAEDVQVEFYDGSLGSAKIISSDPLTDLALVRLVGEVPDGMFVTELGDSDKARIGSRVFAVGAPLGNTHSLTVGFLSARRVTPSLVDEKDLIEVLQTDAAINPGNSGGPLFNMRGKVIGVISYISTVTGGNQGLGFAVSSNTCRDRFLKRPPLWSGMQFISLRGRFAEVLNVPEGKAGLLVQGVVEGSLADRLGLIGGDIPAVINGVEMLLGGDLVLEVNGIGVGEVETGDRIRQSVLELKPDDKLKVVVMRAGSRVVLAKRWSALKGD